MQSWQRQISLLAVNGALALGFSASVALCQDITRLGGDLSSDSPISIALQLPAPNMSSQERFNQHLDGHSQFHGTFTLRTMHGKSVLGPRFNHNSCGGCHVNDGRGSISFSHTAKGSAMLVKVSRKGLNKDGSARNLPGIGEQLQDHTTKGDTRFNIKLKWKNKKHSYPDGQKYTLRRPVLSFEIPGFDKKKILTSLRMTPPTIGMGLLESVPAQDILAMADPDDTNQDGISGKINYVIDHESKSYQIGRFGFKATHPTVRQQTAAALFNDMGVRNEIFTGSGNSTEIDSADFAKLVFYQQAAGVVPARDQSDADVMAGKELFKQTGCDSCHVMTLRTLEGVVSEVSGQEFHPFTDLLLHDMGPELADKRSEFSASGSEWRTTPLWGLGLHKFLSSKAPGFLHDGRARSVEEAILWHGGEGANARAAFKNLTGAQRAQLLRFLDSL